MRIFSAFLAILLFASTGHSETRDSGSRNLLPVVCEVSEMDNVRGTGLGWDLVCTYTIKIKYWKFNKSEDLIQSTLEEFKVSKTIPGYGCVGRPDPEIAEAQSELTQKVEARLHKLRQIGVCTP